MGINLGRMDVHAPSGTCEDTGEQCDDCCKEKKKKEEDGNEPPNSSARPFMSAYRPQPRPGYVSSNAVSGLSNSVSAFLKGGGLGSKRPRSGGSTHVPGNFGSNINGLQTIGGRQELLVQNGALDLKWYFNNKFANGSDNAVQTGGNGGTFGFVRFINTSVSGLTPMVQHYSAEGGLGRNWVSLGGTTQDPTDPNIYSDQNDPQYFKYEMPAGVYYWYSKGDLGTNQTYYVSEREDRQGYALYYHYDGKNLKKITGDVGRLTPYFHHDADDHIDRMLLQDAEGQDSRVTYFYYDVNGALETMVEPEDTVSYFAISSAGVGYQVDKEVDPDLYTAYLVYDTDADADLDKIVQGERTTYFEREQYNVRSTVIKPGGSRRRLAGTSFMDAHAFELNHENPFGSVTRYDYSSNKLTGRFDPNENETTFEINDRKMRTNVGFPDGGSNSYEYAANDIDIVAETGPRHSASTPQVTYYGYTDNGTGRRNRILGPDLTATYYGYDDRYRMVQAMDARGSVTYYGYDQYGQMDAVLDAGGNLAYFAYNANGQVLRKQDALGRTTYYTFDKLDQMKTQESPDGETRSYGYSKRGPRSRETGPDGRQAYYEHDQYYNLTKTARALTGTEYATNYFVYDIDDSLTSQTDPNGNMTTHVYNGVPRRTRTEDALGNISYFIYDPAGNLTYQVDANGVYSRLEYDAMNRLTGWTQGVVGLQPPEKEDIDGYWKLNENSGTRYDTSSNDNDLTQNNDVGSTDGIIGTAAYFIRDDDQYLSIPYASQTGLCFNGSFTIALWANIYAWPPSQSTATARMPLVANWGSDVQGGRGVSFQIKQSAGDNTRHLGLHISRDGSDSLLQFYQGPQINDGSGSDDADLVALNEWHHFAVTFDAVNNEVTQYVDGLADTDNSFGYTPYFSTAEFTIARHQYMINTGWQKDFNFDGAMEQVLSYDKVLTPKEIRTLMQQPPGLTFTLENDPSDTISTYFAHDLDGNQITSVDANANTSYFKFDMMNRQVAALDPLGYSTYFGYDTNGNQTATLDARENVSYFGFDVLNRVDRSQDALDRLTYYGFDAVGNQVQVQYPCLEVEYFGYDSSDRLVQNVDRGGFVTYFGFDGASNQDRMLDPLGGATYFGYDMLDRQTRMLDPLARLTYYEYDLNGNLTRLRTPVWGYGEGPYGGMPYGGPDSNYFVYDGLDRLIRETDQLDRPTYYEYDPVGNQVEVNLPGNRVTQSGYDEFNRLVAQLGPVNDVSYFGYDPASNLTATLNPREYASYFGYDSLSRVTEAQDALGGSTYFVFDEVGNLIRQRDAKSNWTYFEYDALNRLSKTTDAANAETERFYDVSGNLYALVPPVGNPVYFYYDSRNLLESVIDGEQNETEFAYDGNANRTTTVSPREFVTYFGFDAVNRLTQLEDAEGGSAYFRYDPSGVTWNVVDALSRETYFYYDPLGRLTGTKNAIAAEATFTYSEAGNRTEEVDALEHATYYGYDQADRLVAILDPLSKAAYYGYDLNSNLTASLDNNETTVYFAYDGLDRRVAIEYPSETQYFGYDANANLTTTDDDWGVSYFGYDELSRLTRRETPLGDALYYAYDAVSNLTRLQYPQGTTAAYYAYDDANRMTKVQSPSLNTTYYEYDASSNVTKKTLGNGVTCWGTYDKTDRITSLRYTKSDGTPVVYFDYGRDVAGRIMRIGRENDLTVYYAYDDIDRLTGEVWRKTSDLSQIYAFWYDYDAANNRTQMRRESTSGTETESAYYWYDAANALTERTVYPGPVNTYYYYDANGALTKEWDGTDATYYEYGENKLISKITPPTGSPWQFWYDARFNRYAIDKSGTVSYFLWSDLNQVEERDDTGGMVARYTQGYSRIPSIGSATCVERVASGATYFQYVLPDYRGTVQAVTDAVENSQIVYKLDSFGREVATPEGNNTEIPNELVYQTNWLTTTMGSRRYGVSQYRIYDPDTGRFLSRDLLGRFSDLNRYMYAYDNPVSFVDRRGLECKDATGCANVPAVTQSDWGVKSGDSSAVVRWKARRAHLLRTQKILETWQKNVRNSCCPDKDLQRELMEAHRNVSLAIGHATASIAISQGQVGGQYQSGTEAAYQAIADTLRGAGDTISLGATKSIRDALWGSRGKVKNKFAYGTGMVAGAVVQSYLSGGLATAARAKNASLLVRTAYQAQLAGRVARSSYAAAKAINDFYAGRISATQAGLTTAKNLIALAGAFSSAAAFDRSQCIPSDPREFFKAVGPGSHNYENAQQGFIAPMGGQASAYEHVQGNTASPYTSWSRTEEGAENFGEDYYGPGRYDIYKVTNPNNPAYPVEEIFDPWTGEAATSEEYVEEYGEVLLEGLVSPVERAD